MSVGLLEEINCQCQVNVDFLKKRGNGFFQLEDGEYKVCM